MNTLDASRRWAVEFKPAGSRQWIVVGTVGTRDRAEWFLLHLRGTGDWYVRPPKAVARG